MMGFIYADFVEFLGNEKPQSIEGYRKVEHLPGWVIWRWADETLAIPSDRIKSISTSEI